MSDVSARTRVCDIVRMGCCIAQEQFEADLEQWAAEAGSQDDVPPALQAALAKLTVSSPETDEAANGQVASNRSAASSPLQVCQVRYGSMCSERCA